MDGYQYATLSAALVVPLSRGNISISSADTADQPLINPNWLTSPTDQQVAVATYKRARQTFETPVMRQNVDIGPEYFPGSKVTTDAQILNLIRQSFNTLSHATSTCKMGRRNDTDTVVDTQGRVYGVSNLRVVDTSIFPFLPPGLPMGTVCMSALSLFITRSAIGICLKHMIRSCKAFYSNFSFVSLCHFQGTIF